MFAKAQKQSAVMVTVVIITLEWYINKCSLALVTYLKSQQLLYEFYLVNMKVFILVVIILMTVDASLLKGNLKKKVLQELLLMKLKDEIHEKTGKIRAIHSVKYAPK